MRRARWAARILRRLPGGFAIRALAAIDGAEERQQLPARALALLLRRRWLLPPLRWMAAARQIEPSSASRIARGLADAGRIDAAERLVRAALVPFPENASLRRDRLRLLDRLSRREALDRYAGALATDVSLDGETGWLIWTLTGQPTVAARFGEHGTAPAIERARFARRQGRAFDALGHYRDALETASTDPSLAEAAAAILEDDAWPAGLDIVEEAATRALIRAGDPLLAAVRTVAARNPMPLSPLPRLAFEDLSSLAVTPSSGAGPILMVANGLACGGMERVLAATIAGLRSRGRDVRLALSSFEPDDPASRFFLPATGLSADAILPLAPRGVPGGVTAALPRRWRGEAAALAAIVTRLRPAVVHAWNDRLGLLAGVAALPAGAPRLLVHLHHMRPTRDPDEAAAATDYPACLRLLAARQDVAMAVCAQAAATDYADWTGAPCDTFHPVLNGFADEPAITPGERALARKRFGLPATAPVVASLFRFEAVKQPLVWLDAAAAIARHVPGTRFLMAGDGELLGASRARAATLGLDIRFPGRVSDTRAVLAAADLLMMSSASEGLPNGAVEAQLAGVPVIAFDVGGMAETMRPGATGRLVPANDIAALAAAAAGWLRDAAARAQAGSIARVFAREAFGMERYLDAIAALYRPDPVG